MNSQIGISFCYLQIGFEIGLLIAHEGRNGIGGTATLNYRLGFIEKHQHTLPQKGGKNEFILD